MNTDAEEKTACPIRVRSPLSLHTTYYMLSTVFVWPLPGRWGATPPLIFARLQHRPLPLLQRLRKPLLKPLRLPSLTHLRKEPAQRPDQYADSASLQPLLQPAGPALNKPRNSASAQPPSLPLRRHPAPRLRPPLLQPPDFPPVRPLRRRLVLHLNQPLLRPLDFPLLQPSHQRPAQRRIQAPHQPADYRPEQPPERPSTGFLLRLDFRWAER